MTQHPILLIDDSQDIIEIASLILESEGYKVRAAATCGEALKILESVRQFSLILLDMTLPDMDTATFLKEMRRRKLGLNSPIVFFTAASDLKQINLPPGIVGHINKPFTIASFVKDLKKFINTSGESDMRQELSL